MLDTLTQFTWNLNDSSEKQSDKKPFVLKLNVQTHTRLGLYSLSVAVL